jgi:hypothetical protein
MGQLKMGEEHHSTVTSSTFLTSTPNMQSQLTMEPKPSNKLTFSPGLMFNCTNATNLTSYYSDDDEETLFYDTTSTLSDTIYQSMNISKVNTEEFFDAFEYFPEGEISQKESASFLSSINWLYLLCFASWLIFSSQTMLAMFVLPIIFKACQFLGSVLESLCMSRMIQNGPIKRWNHFSYPACYMLLSHVMLTNHFCAMFGWNTKEKPKNAIDKYSKSKLVSVNPSTNDLKSRLSRLALISALGKVYSLPSLGSQVTMAHQRTLRKQVNSMGFIQPSMLIDPLTIQALKSQSEPLTEVTLEGSFNVIVDTGCTVTATFCREDFEELQWLLRSVELVGVGGVTKVYQGGTVRYDCIDSEGRIVTLRCFAYYNPNMEIRLFSP